LAIKKQQSGLISIYLCDQAKVGDIIDIMAPAGNFILPQNINPLQLVAFASGSGITPVMSMDQRSIKSSRLDHYLILR
jgi:ring-1,2-phenylacetyl-CoA epoxidase subunit PaaE